MNIYIINDTHLIHIYKPSINDDQKKKNVSKMPFPTRKSIAAHGTHMDVPSSGACLGVGAAVATTEDAIARWPRTAEPWEVIGGWALKVYHTNKC